jgi:hypothetical protein
MRRTILFLFAFLMLGSFATAKMHAAQTPPEFQPDPKSVQRYGPAYRYPQAGWIVLHIEGEPYERGYQHGKLLAPEIAAHIRCFAATQCSKSPSDGWKQTRTLVNALFMRRYHEEFLEEMKGIADGAAAGGAKYEGRPVDLLDVVSLNAWPEVDTLDSALEATATGLEGKRFPKAQPKKMPAPKPMHCSAFAATGPATADGKIVFGHITMFGLYPGSFYNIWLDVKPAKGHRVIMQSYPAGIQSGLDYYMNDAGLLVCETTLAQTKFDIRGLTVASRIRQALQYADNIDMACEILAKENNGLYTNEWLLGDTKTNEIAMFELGTHKSHLYRSGKKEWFGGTEGFYWGCNNTKDHEVRLETVASLDGSPANVVFHPSDRDKMWLKLYSENKGKINADFGKKAFTTPPLAAYHSLDAKFTTSDMAKDLQSWAVFGPPLGKTWLPTDDEKRRFPEIKPLVGNPWAIVHVNAPAVDKSNGKAPVDLKGHGDHDAHEGKETEENLLAASEDDTPPSRTVWHGTLFSKTDADIWLAAAFADYHRYVVAEKNMRLANDGKLKDEDKERLEVYRNNFRSRYLAAAKSAGDKPLNEIKKAMETDEWYRIASGKGFLLMNELRQLLGDPLFEDTMDAFGKDHGGKEVTSAEFQGFVEKKTDKKLDKFFETWLKEKGLPAKSAKEEAGLGSSLYTLRAFHLELDKSLIVYGTVDELNTNREGAEALQKAIRQAHSNFTVPVKSDKDVTDDDLKNNHLLLIGRPDTNSVVEKLQKALPIQFGYRSFVVGKDSYAHAGSSVATVGNNPTNDRYSVVVIAGNTGASTREAAIAFMNRGEGDGAEVIIAPNSGKVKALAIPANSANAASNASAKR